jgi:hypothetical protein
MKTLSLVLLLAVSMTFILMGCSDSSMPTVPASGRAISSPGTPIVMSKSGVSHSLTGSAHTYNIYDPEFGILPAPKEKGNFYNVYTINAVDQGGGKFSGSLLSQLQKYPKDGAFGGLAKIKANVIQLVVDETGTMAKVVCQITEWTPWPGTTPQRWLVVVFVDNGEGKTADPRDQESAWWFSRDDADRDLWLGMSPQEYLDWTEPQMGGYPLTIPIDNGNIQVR